MAGGDVFGALAKTTARPMRSGGTGIVRISAAGGTQCTTARSTEQKMLSRTTHPKKQWSCLSPAPVP
jgi:hypothetical protein